MNVNTSLARRLCHRTCARRIAAVAHVQKRSRQHASRVEIAPHTANRRQVVCSRESLDLYVSSVNGVSNSFLYIKRFKPYFCTL